jgi:transcriptional regulator with XRE-family HTH domain
MSEPGYDIGESPIAQELRIRVTMLAVQSRMARAALGWGVRELAAAAKVSPDTIARLERGETLYPRTVDAIRTALEAAGVEFIAENGGGPGVRLRRA